MSVYLPPKTGPRGLVGFEESGEVRRAFARLGYEMWSCDTQPAADGSNMHLRCDIRDVLHLGWDFLAILHPPCTRLCNSGVRWLHGPPPGRTLEEMWAELEEAADLFSTAWNAPIDRVCVENPVMHRHAKALIANYEPPAQHVQPWWFGDPAFKSTGLYLRGLPPLVPTNRLTPPRTGTAEHRAWSVIHRAPRTPDRARRRSRTFPGVAHAFASQWGPVWGGQEALAAWRRAGMKAGPYIPPGGAEGPTVVPVILGAGDRP